MVVRRGGSSSFLFDYLPNDFQFVLVKRADHGSSPNDLLRDLNGAFACPPPFFHIRDGMKSFFDLSSLSPILSDFGSHLCIDGTSEGKRKRRSCRWQRDRGVLDDVSTSNWPPHLFSITFKTWTKKIVVSVFFRCPHFQKKFLIKVPYYWSFFSGYCHTCSIVYTTIKDCSTWGWHKLYIQKQLYTVQPVLVHFLGQSVVQLFRWLMSLDVSNIRSREKKNSFVMKSLCSMLFKVFLNILCGSGQGIYTTQWLHYRVAVVFFHRFQLHALIRSSWSHFINFGVIRGISMVTPLL